MKGAVFMDRDGTISEEVGYLNELDQLRLIPKSVEAIKLINESGLMAIVITNQSGVARGYFTEEMVHRVHEKMEKLLDERDVHLEGIYYCPHHPEGVVESYRKTCNCRKPASGLLKKASKDHGIDLAASYIVGDKLIDIELAYKVGAKGILVLTGYGKDELEKINDVPEIRPAYVADTLFNAAKWIINDLGVKSDGNPDCKIECHR
ncbi:MAG: HAD family hydrolase [Deltaproteobacteria bacterium]|nr:HAD family hydrolase [Deltaproteobacteria bacterium]